MPKKVKHLSSKKKKNIQRSSSLDFKRRRKRKQNNGLFHKKNSNLIEGEIKKLQFLGSGRQRSCLCLRYVIVIKNYLEIVEHPQIPSCNYISL